jgi:hypothetical protein
MCAAGPLRGEAGDGPGPSSGVNALRYWNLNRSGKTTTTIQAQTAYTGR